MSAAPSITSTVTEVCEDGSLTLTATPAGGTWSASSGSIANPSSTTTTSTAAFTSSSGGTTYTVTYTAGGVDATVSVTVLAPPTISPSTATEVCIGSDVTLVGSGTASTSTPWSSDDVSIATVSNGVVTGVATGVATITYTNNKGCEVTKDVTVNGLPNVSAGADQTICDGSSATLTSSTMSSYNWSTGATTSSITVSPTQTTTYTLTGVDANGCENQDDVTVTVEDLPSVSVASGSSVLCEGETVTLSSTVTGGTWSSDNNSVATVSTTGIVTAKSVTTQSTAVITFTSTSNCTGSITVTVNPALAISGTLTATVGGTEPILLINGNTKAAASS